MSQKRLLTKPSCEDVEERWQRNKCEKGKMKGNMNGNMKGEHEGEGDLECCGGEGGN